MTGTSKNSGKQKVYIKSGEDLFDGLRHPDPALRTAILKTVHKNPDTAMAYGKVNGRDLIDELLFLYQESRGSVDCLAYAYTLFGFNDARVTAFAEKAFYETDNTEIMLLAGTIIAKIPENKRKVLLCPAVWDAENPVRGRAAANLLADCRNLSADIKLRVAILSDHKVDLPEFNCETAQAWLAEMQGDYLRKARKAFLALGRHALKKMLDTWPVLSCELQQWLIYQLAENGIDGAGEKIKEIIEERIERLLPAALECYRILDIKDDNIILPLCDHNNPDIRSAGIKAIKTYMDLSDRVFTEESLKVRLAAMTHMAGFGGQKEADALAELLGDDSWRIRARAAKCLARMAPLSLPALKDAYNSDIENTRIAASQALHALGMKI